MTLITHSWSLDSVIILASLTMVAYLYATRKFKYWQRKGIPEVPPIPFIGNFGNCLLLKQSPQDFLKNLYDQAAGKPCLGIYILDKPALVIFDRKIIQNILIKDFNYFYDRYSSSDPNDRIGYANLFFLKYPAWKILRTKLTPFFTSGKLKYMFNLMLECTKNLDEYLDTLGLEGNGKVMEIKALSTRFTANVISNTVFDCYSDPFKNPNDEFHKIGSLLFKFSFLRGFELFSIFFLPNMTSILHSKMFGKKPTIFIRTKFWEVFTSRMHSGQKRNDFIDVLVELNKSQGDQDIHGFKFDGEDLLAQAASFFSAGFDTSAMPVVFTLYLLAKNPDVQIKLRTEIHETLDKFDGNITYDVITSDLVYIEMVLLEVMRLYPPLGFLNRHVMVDYKIPDTDIVLEKGTPIFIPSLGLHYDPQYFPDPYKFDPERFSKENKRTIPSCVYLPFGDGPHSCIGTRYAMLMMKLILLTIVKKYELTLCKESPNPLMLDPKSCLASPLNEFDGDDLMAQAASFFAAAGFDTSLSLLCRWPS